VKEKLKQIMEPRVQNKNQAQGFIYVVVGGYLCYIAYSLIKAFLTEDATMSLLVTILFAVFFVFFGLAIITFGGYVIYFNYKMTPDPNAAPKEAIEESSTDLQPQEETENKS